MSISPPPRSSVRPAEPRPSFRGRVYDSILETVGATPLVRLGHLPAEAGCKAEVLAKLEFLNPLGSVKDRIGLAMVEAAEAEGLITPGTTVLIEPTSGNTGIALAFVSAAKGYRLILTMPDSQSMTPRKMLALMGAELVLTPATAGMQGAIARAEALRDELDDAFILQQFKNPANPAIHRATTGEEIWRDTEGAVDVVVSSVGTGGTLTGVAQALKARKPGLVMVAVEPEDSAVLSGRRPGQHKIQGIGAGFIPDILDVSLIDEVIPIANETAFATARRAAQAEGLPCGISSGAALAAALEVGGRDGMAGKQIVAILASFAERDLASPLFEGL